MDKLIPLSVTFRTILKSRTVFTRGVNTTQFFCTESMEKFEKNPFFEKYADKIAKLQKTSSEELLSRIEAHEKSKQKPRININEERKYSSLLEPKKNLSPNSSSLSLEAKDECLDKIMKLDLVKDKSAEEIKKIWEEYHIHKDVIAAIIPSTDYEMILEESKKYPTFLFPIPRSQGYEFFVSQFLRNSIHFTPLLYFQVHKENAPECLTIKHYVEFKDDKGIVLMRGEFDKNLLNSKEAQCLANQLLLYYSRKDPERTQLLERFTKKPDEFKHIDLIKHIENLSL